MKRLLLVALSLALVGVGSACSDSTGPGSAVAGTYILTSVGGQSPPVTIFNNGSSREDVTAGRIVLDANGNYSDFTTFQDFTTGFPPTTSQESIFGFWALSGNQIQLTDSSKPNQPVVAFITNGQISFTDFSTGTAIALVYTKQ